ncbi:MAG: DUF1257 domain-containing protein [Armatimonadetes bacterium]|nr:DUF1257 domain-containing protein [Armatimonadota bacterium]
MSHFTRVKTQLRNLVLLERALRDLGYTPSVGNVAVRGWNGQTMPGQAGESLELVADEWGFRGDLQAVLGRVAQRYAYHVCVAEAEAQGFAVTGTETLEDGSIRLLVERFE